MDAPSEAMKRFIELLRASREPDDPELIAAAQEAGLGAPETTGGAVISPDGTWRWWAKRPDGTVRIGRAANPADAREAIRRARRGHPLPPS